MLTSDAPGVKAYWENACSEMGIAPSSAYTASTFGDPKFFDEIDEITVLALEGQKKATSHLEIDFEVNNIPVRKEGEYWLMLDKALNPRGIVQLTTVKITPFNEIDDAYAAIEGEGDSSLRHWKEVHEDYFKLQLGTWGREWSEDLPVVCEIFKLVYPPLEK
jgi:histidinol-phosphate aminotransferase